MNETATYTRSSKSLIVAALLAFFLGCFGIHRFYVGKWLTGILQILTLGGLGIWALIDFVLIVVGEFKDSEGCVLTNK
ncbi:TM2 domain-containing protein [Alteromonadaceae bacterium 2753L.S.0a.02]|nr:TM2 domain-containing protein [Alteromonadaceae bacterium 2753L.S.0a.02]